MHYIETNLPQFAVAGIAVRTSNQNGQSAKDIGALWQRFFRENILGQIPHKLSDDIYCVYTDYESDANGAYTTILGCSVASTESLPEGLTFTTVPQSDYRLYGSKGKQPDGVLAVWHHIWQTPVARGYKADFDVYGTNAQDPDNAEVETYLSLP